MPDQHVHRDLWLGIGLTLLAVSTGTPVTVWAVRAANPSAHVSLWPNPFIFAAMGGVLLSLYILSALLFHWPLPGGFVAPPALTGAPDRWSVPMAPPVEYQVRQLRQVIRKVSETWDAIDPLVLGSVLTNLDRKGRDPVYEPLHPASVKAGLAKLAEEGVLEHVGPSALHYKIRRPKGR